MTATSIPLGRSPLHAWHEARGATFAQRHGWCFAESFPDTTEPRAGLYLADITPFAKRSFTGKSVASLARAAASELQPGSVALIPSPYPGWLAYLSDDQLLFLSTHLGEHGAATARLPNQPDQPAPSPWDVTSAYAGFLLIGTDAQRFVGGLLNLPAALAPGVCVETGLFGVPSLLARGPDEQTTIGIWVGCDVALYLWERLWQAAAARCVSPLGASALREFGWHA